MDSNQNSGNSQTTGNKILVAYFSWSGTSERIAKNIIEQTGADSYRIERRTPYSNDYSTVAFVKSNAKGATVDDGLFTTNSSRISDYVNQKVLGK